MIRIGLLDYYLVIRHSNFNIVGQVDYEVKDSVTAAKSGALIPWQCLVIVFMV